MITQTDYRRSTPEEKEVLRRQAILDIKSGRSQYSIARDLGVSREAVRLWCQRAEQDPENGLVALPPGPPCLLSAERLDRLREELLTGAEAHGFPDPMWTIERTRKLVRKLFKVAYGKGSLRHVLITRLGFSCQKPEKRAKERDEERIRTWKEETFPARKKKRHQA